MRKVLIAIDGSEHAMRAVAHVVADAPRWKDETQVHLLNVQEMPTSHRLVDPASSDAAWHAAHQESGRRVLAPVEQVFSDAGIHCSSSVSVGPIAQTIAERAKALGCEEVVMGTRGMSALGDLVMGSVAARVVHLAPVPVTLVR